MKNQFLILITLIFLISCDETNIEKNIITSEPSKTTADYSVLEKIGSEILSLSADENFKKLVYNYIEMKPFDEYVVLTEYLKRGLKSQKISSNSRSNSSIYPDSLLDSSNENYYPQIYIYP